LDKKDAIQQQEFDKLPDDIKTQVKSDLNIHESNKVDWHGIDAIKEQIDEENTTNDENIENKNNSNKLVDSVVNKMIDLFSKSEKDIQEICIDETGYYKIGNVKIKDGVIYAKEVQDIIDANIKPSKNILWVVIPHIKDLPNGSHINVPLRYVKHNGLWWVSLPETMIIENIEYELFNPTDIPDSELIAS
jgi:hypothetical protein